MVEKFEIHTHVIADSFLASLTARGASYGEAEAHAVGKISDPDVRSRFLERARKVLDP